MKRWRAVIEVLEDLHTGTGTGYGEIDAIQARDRRGWPVLPSSHIKGVLRAVAREWSQLDSSMMTTADIARLFGKAGGSRGLVKCTGAYLLQEHMPLTWGSTRIDPQTGSAQEGSLRIFEYVPAGARFQMEIALLDGCAPDDEARLLGVIRRCASLGGGRNRGQGRVRWQLEAVEAPVAPDVPVRTELPARLRLVLRNLDSLCLARTGHPGNIIATEAFIRGRTLRGAMAALCLSAKRADLAQRMLDPRLSWGDALPLPVATLQEEMAASCQVVPIPLSIGTPKRSAASPDIPWWAMSGNQSVFGARGEQDQLNPVATGQPTAKLKRPGADEFLFLPSPGEAWRRYRPQILGRMHTSIPNAENNDSQGLYHTEEIAENTLFLSDLIVTEISQAQALVEALKTIGKNWLCMGRGGKPVVIEQALWLAQPAAAEKPAADSFTLLLESDLIARNEEGNFHSRLDAPLVAALAGYPEAEIRASATFSEGVDLFGFNASTGLPRLAQHAIRAGSVIRIEGPDTAKVKAALSAKLALGESPDEGCGRFRIDGLPIPETRMEAPSLPPLEPSRFEALCQEARALVQEFGNSLAKPSASQWGEFRSRVHAARSAGELGEVFSRLKAAAEKLGGKDWAAFVEHPSYAKLRARTEELAIEEAQFLLDNFVRWARVCFVACRDSEVM